jgi:hypothetical protein
MSCSKVSSVRRQAKMRPSSSYNVFIFMLRCVYVHFRIECSLLSYTCCSPPGLIRGVRASQQASKVDPCVRKFLWVESLLVCESAPPPPFSNRPFFPTTPLL